MSQKRRKEIARKQAAARRRPWMWLGFGLAVAVAAVVAVVAGGSSGSKPTAAGIAQTRPVTVTGSLPSFSGSGTDPAIGLTIPTIHGQSFDGTAVSIEPNGHPKVIIVAAHWCPHCQAELPRISQYFETHPVPAGVEVTVVSTDVSTARPNYPPSEWLATIHWPTPVLADDDKADAAGSLAVPGFPYFVVVDANGQVVARTSGEIGTDAFAALLEQARSSIRG